MRFSRLLALGGVVFGVSIGAGAARAAVLTQPAPGICLYDQSGHSLSSPQALAFSSDGATLYVASPSSSGHQGDGAITSYKRNSDGSLSFLEVIQPNGASCGGKKAVLKGASAVTVSPDNQNVYVTAKTNN